MNLIVAVTRDYAIGKDNKLLFHLPADLAYFKEKTLGKVVIMGEKTYLSLPKRPLPKRINIVLSDNLNFVAKDATVVHTLKDLFLEIKKYDSEDVFVCGGASIYNLLMDYCSTAYITKVDAILPADTFIHKVEDHGFRLKSASTPQTENGLTFSFQVFEKEPKHIPSF